jgi:hypothetical protein
MIIIGLMSSFCVLVMFVMSEVVNSKGVEVPSGGVGRYYFFAGLTLSSVLGLCDVGKRLGEKSHLYVLGRSSKLLP